MQFDDRMDAKLYRVKRSAPKTDRIKKRRTTLTLPAESLGRAERIARARKVNLSTVVSEALNEGLRVHEITERSEQVMKAYRRVFSGLTEEEMALVDGIILEPRRNGHRG
jgi:post-segregation antitoxin (ccd killing protein)